MIPLLLLELVTSSSLACGGFFCNTEEPVEQAGEVVVFEVDEEVGETTMHVKVEYSGPAESFAWVVPVPANPDTFITTDLLFDMLDLQTQPVFGLRTDYGSCDFGWDSDTDADTDTDTDTDSDIDYDTAVPDSGVIVVSTGTVGPYDQAVLRATDGEVLVEWLQANGYDVPDDLSPLLQPYTGGDTHFLALKLTKGSDTGALAPLGLTYAGTTPGIPIGLTAVAATPDMPVRTYLLGDRIAVPTSWFHVELSPLHMPWGSYLSSDYDALVRDAVDEAGGRGFVTSYAGPSDFTIWSGQYTTDGLEQLELPVDWFLALDDKGFGGTSELLDVLRVVVPAPSGVDETDFYNCPSCFADAWASLEEGFDAVEATAYLHQQMVAPREEAQAIVDRNAMLTRLDSAVSPEEMTVDPMFAFVDGRAPVEVFRSAEIRYHCDPGSEEIASRTVALPTGHEVPVSPSFDQVQTELEGMSDHKALRVEQCDAAGGCTTVTDHTAELDALQGGASTPGTDDATDPGPSRTPWGYPWPDTDGTSGTTAEASSGRACGCMSTGGRGWLGLVVPLLLGLRRRR